MGGLIVVTVFCVIAIVLFWIVAAVIANIYFKHLENKYEDILLLLAKYSNAYDKKSKDDD